MLIIQNFSLCDENTLGYSDGNDINENCHDSSESEPPYWNSTIVQEWIKGHVLFEDCERCYVKGEEHENKH